MNYEGHVKIKDGKIVEINISAPGTKLSEISQIMTLRNILDRYIIDYEKEYDRQK